MLLVVRDYIWEEMEKMLFFIVFLKGVKVNKVDILLLEDYIKVYMWMFNINDYDIFWIMCYIWGIS